MADTAWVTLATNDSYALGAQVLAHSLKKVNTKHKLVVLVTPGVTECMREKLGKVFDLVHLVDILDSKDAANLALLARPELGVTFTKLHCWRLVQFKKCVFLDADTLVIQNCDDLFEREELSAAPDVGWPDCFNSGVFVYKPSFDTFDALLKLAKDRGSFDGGDQGLLNTFFADWSLQDRSRRLPFVYNLCSVACYSYLPAFKQFGQNVRIFHFIGTSKPWLQHFDTVTCQVRTPAGDQHLGVFMQFWWNIFFDKVHSTLNPSMGGLAAAFAQMSLGVPLTGDQIAFEDKMRKEAWEAGHIDYMGRDSFDNILHKISETLSLGPAKDDAPKEQSKKEDECVKPVAEVATCPIQTQEIKKDVSSDNLPPQDNDVKETCKLAYATVAATEKKTEPAVPEAPKDTASPQPGVGPAVFVGPGIGPAVLIKKTEAEKEKAPELGPGVVSTVALCPNLTVAEVLTAPKVSAEPAAPGEAAKDQTPAAPVEKPGTPAPAGDACKLPAKPEGPVEQPCTQAPVAAPLESAKKNDELPKEVIISDVKSAPADAAAPAKEAEKSSEVKIPATPEQAPVKPSEGDKNANKPEIATPAFTETKPAEAKTVLEEAQGKPLPETKPAEAKPEEKSILSGAQDKPLSETKAPEAKPVVEAECQMKKVESASESTPAATPGTAADQAVPKTPGVIEATPPSSPLTSLPKVIDDKLAQVKSTTENIAKGVVKACEKAVESSCDLVKNLLADTAACKKDEEKAVTEPLKSPEVKEATACPLSCPKNLNLDNAAPGTPPVCPLKQDAFKDAIEKITEKCEGKVDGTKVDCQKECQKECQKVAEQKTAALTPLVVDDKAKPEAATGPTNKDVKEHSGDAKAAPTMEPKSECTKTPVVESAPIAPVEKCEAKPPTSELKEEVKKSEDKIEAAVTPTTPESIVEPTAIKTESTPTAVGAPATPEVATPATPDAAPLTPEGATPIIPVTEQGKPAEGEKSASKPEAGKAGGAGKKKPAAPKGKPEQAEKSADGSGPVPPPRKKDPAKKPAPKQTKPAPKK